MHAHIQGLFWVEGGKRGQGVLSSLDGIDINQLHITHALWCARIVHSIYNGRLYALAPNYYRGTCTPHRIILHGLAWHSVRGFMEIPPPSVALRSLVKGF